MLNSLLMLGSTSKKMGKITYLCAFIWIGYMLMNANLNSKAGLIFTGVNLIVFLITFAIGKIVKGKYSNVAVSIFSIIIWSILIDLACFYMFPQFAMGQNIIGYIGSGIEFNFKYVFSNIFVLSAVYLCDWIKVKQNCVV